MLRKFADAGGKTFKFDKRNGSISKITPRKAAAEVGFNEFIFEGKPMSLEFRFEQYETAVAPLLKKITQERSTKFLSSTDRSQISEFIVLQSFRTEAFHRGFAPHLTRKEFGVQLQSALQNLDFIANFVRARPFLLMHTEASAPFWLGDSPVTLQRTDQASDAHQLGFDLPGVDVYFPLDPENALYLPCPMVAKEIVSGYLNAKRIHQEIRLATMQGKRHIFDGSEFVRITQRTLMNSQHLYEAVMSGTPIAASAENVENFNFLQLRGASSSVFSRLGDFSLAEIILKNSPNNRNVQRVTMQSIF